LEAGKMKLKYKRLPLNSEADFSTAEKFQAQGWRVILLGWNYVLLEK
jgi:hypothetical protein